jgi:RimJ/RimL family protein N-acetyltransferase
MPDPLRFPVPTELLTERLLLRPFRQEDAPVLHAAIAESISELRQHLWFLPWVAEEPSPESALVRCRQAEAAFLLRTDLPFLAFNRGTGRLVASVGLHRTDWNIPRTEVGYWVRTGEKGNGYASEGVNALTKWALGQLRAIRVELITDEPDLVQWPSDAASCWKESIGTSAADPTVPCGTIASMRDTDDGHDSR